MNTKTKIQNQFNDKAEQLGCRARIGGNKKHPLFFEFRGAYGKGFEIWHGIDVNRFVILTNKYPELQN